MKKGQKWSQHIKSFQFSNNFNKNKAIYKQTNRFAYAKAFQFAVVKIDHAYNGFNKKIIKEFKDYFKSIVKLQAFDKKIKLLICIFTIG